MTKSLLECLIVLCSCGKSKALEKGGGSNKRRMNPHEVECEALLSKCKQEAKQLAEFTATRRKLHWSHPSFISFCVSVEDILSHGVKKRYRASKSKPVTSSGKILHDVGKTYPDAASVYAKCFSSSPAGRDDYATLQTSSQAERKMLWIRVALIEGKLRGIIGEMVKNRRQYYTEQSLICHPVYGEIFPYLLDGPCVIRFSRLKTSDAAAYNPSPSEIVERHNRVLSISVSKTQQDKDGQPHVGTEEAWGHVRSLYQSVGSTCLFGKNNILMQPVGFSEPLQGYLSLQMAVTSLVLKWIPNALLQDPTSDAKSLLWDSVLSVDVVNKVAHIHCHRTPGHSAKMSLIGYDGIAYPSIIFSHHPSLFHFLECLENSLLPQGCLEPPLWYIKQQTTKANKSNLGAALKMISGSSVEEERWFEGLEGWNQVFRVRYGSRQEETKVKFKPVIEVKPPSHMQPLPLNMTVYPHPQPGEPSESSSDSDEEPSPRSPGPLAKKDMEKFQLKTSKQLLARYFYSWLSYCRHMSKVRTSVAHMINTSRLILDDDPAHTHSILSEELWREFTEIRNEEKWTEIVKVVYLKGIENNKLRAKVWPYLLGLYPVASTKEERATIDQQGSDAYHQALIEWKEVDRIQSIIAERERVRRTTMVARLPTPKMAQGDHQVNRVATSVSPSRPVAITETDPFTDSRGSSPSLYSISPSSTPELRDKKLRSPSVTEPSPNDNVELNHSQMQTDLADQLQEHSTHAVPSLHAPGFEANAVPCASDSELMNGSKGFQMGPDDLQVNSTGIDSNSVHGIASSSLNKVQNGPIDGPSEDGESVNGAEITILEAVAREEEVSEPPTVMESHLAASREGKQGGERGSVPVDNVDCEETLDSKGQAFAEELFKIDKDIPRCDRDYWYFKQPQKLTILRNIVSTYVWTHLDVGYSQGMCDLLAPLLVILDNETQAYATFLLLMETDIKLFPPYTDMNNRLGDVRELLQVLEPDYFQYLLERPLGDGLFYCYRWFLVKFKREFDYSDIFRLWETIWASRLCVSNHFDEFFALAIMQQFKTAIMDAHLDPSDILNLYTDLAEKRAIDCTTTIKLTQATIAELQGAITKN